MEESSVLQAEHALKFNETKLDHVQNVIQLALCKNEHSLLVNIVENTQVVCEILML